VRKNARARAKTPALPDAIPDAYVVTDKDALQEQADRQLQG